MRRVLLTAVIIASGAVLLPAPAFAGSGAVAWDKATGKYGWSRNQSTQQKADELAISQCGASGCKVVVRMSGATLCAALATTQDGKNAGAASRKTQDDARLAALANCQKLDKGECIIRISECGK
jgi:serine/threonine-protein kinase